MVTKFRRGVIRGARRGTGDGDAVRYVRITGDAARETETRCDAWRGTRRDARRARESDRENAARYVARGRHTAHLARANL
eukprot:4678517-Prymnesium_polylepis.1